MKMKMKTMNRTKNKNRIKSKRINSGRRKMMIIMMKLNKILRLLKFIRRRIKLSRSNHCWRRRSS